MRQARAAIGMALAVAAPVAVAGPAHAADAPPPRDYATGVCADAERGHFSDVPDSHYAAVAIDCLASGEPEIVFGHPDGTYRPTDVVTRADVAVYLGRVAEAHTYAAVFDDNTPPPFEDLDDVTHTQFRYIRGLHNRDVIDGVTPQTYAPDRPVTRAQVASLTQRMHELVQREQLASEPQPLPDGSDYFRDDDDSVHELAINRITAAGVLQGTGDDRYEPHGHLTRAQLALLCARYLQFYADTTQPA